MTPRAYWGAWRKRLSATYDFAIHTHGSIGPSCAVAEFRRECSRAGRRARRRTTCASSSPRCSRCPRRKCARSTSTALAAMVATATRMPPQTRRSSRETLGQPVRVQWMRADEHGWDPKGPPTLIDVQGGLDADGNVVAWHSQFYLPDGAASNVRARRGRARRPAARAHHQPGRHPQRLRHTLRNSPTC